MRFEVSLSKRSLVVFAFAFLIFGSFFAYAVTPNPGHDASGIGPGMFGGLVGERYSFPGGLGIGPGSIDDTGIGGPGFGPRNLFINSSTNKAGIGISSHGAGGDTYIDFINDNQIKANLDYRTIGEFQINAHSQAASTTTKIITPDNVTIQGRNPTRGAAPALLLRESGATSFWSIMKRGSQSTPVGQRDGLLFSYTDTTGSYEPLFLNKTSMCVFGDCQTSAYGAGGLVYTGSFTLTITNSNCGDQLYPVTVVDSAGKPVKIDYVTTRVRPANWVTLGPTGFKMYEHQSSMLKSDGTLYPFTVSSNNEFIEIAETVNGHVIGRISDTTVGRLEFCKENSISGSLTVDFVAFSSRTP